MGAAPNLIFLRKVVFSNMVNVKVRDGESIEEAIRRFKRECERNGIMQEIKKREFYKAPSVVRKEKLAEAKRKIRRKMLKDSRWSR
jgi:small subunit ribosomal protein S21